MTLEDLAEAERDLEAYEREQLERRWPPLTEEELDGVRFTLGGTLRAERLG